MGRLTYDQVGERSLDTGYIKGAVQKLRLENVRTAFPSPSPSPPPPLLSLRSRVNLPVRLRSYWEPSSPGLPMLQLWRVLLFAAESGGSTTDKLCSKWMMMASTLKSTSSLTWICKKMCGPHVAGPSAGKKRYGL